LSAGELEARQGNRSPRGLALDELNAPLCASRSQEALQATSHRPSSRARPPDCSASAMRFRRDHLPCRLWFASSERVHALRSRTAGAAPFAIRPLFGRAPTMPGRGCLGSPHRASVRRSCRRAAFRGQPCIAPAAGIVARGEPGQSPSSHRGEQPAAPLSEVVSPQIVEPCRALSRSCLTSPTRADTFVALLVLPRHRVRDRSRRTSGAIDERHVVRVRPCRRTPPQQAPCRDRTAAP
jgi:hypothetical protein